MKTYTFGEILKHARLDSGMTQAQLACYAGVDRTYISKLENGSFKRERLNLPSPHVVKRLIDALKDDALSFRYMKILMEFFDEI